MAQLTIRGQTVDVDIVAELEQFEWIRPRWSSDKLLAASPFRDDRTPSFFVRLEPYDDLPAGVWSDQGAYDEEWTSGNFAKLLAFLRNESYEEAEEYLLDTYGMGAATGETLILPQLRLKLSRNRQALKESVLAGYSGEPSEYLLKRGITADVQLQLGVRNGGNHIVIPWRGTDGRLSAVKHRSVNGKLFWYERGGAPLRDLLWGLDVVFAERAKVAVLAEAEIDAMSWRVAGVPAIANGGVAFNAAKRDLIIRSPIEELIIATDNDKAGEKLRAEVEQELRGYVRVRQAHVLAEVKDANEALVKYGVGALREAAATAELERNLYVNLRTVGRG